MTVFSFKLAVLHMINVNLVILCIFIVLMFHKGRKWQKDKRIPMVKIEIFRKLATKNYYELKGDRMENRYVLFYSLEFII